MLDSFGTGACSAAAAGALARAVVAESGPNAAPSMCAVARIGTDGRHPSNAERDLQVLLRGMLGIAVESYEINIMVCDKNNVETQPFKLSVHGHVCKDVYEQLCVGRVCF